MAADGEDAGERECDSSSMVMQELVRNDRYLVPSCHGESKLRRELARVLAGEIPQRRRALGDHRLVEGLGFRRPDTEPLRPPVSRALPRWTPVWFGLQCR